MQRTIGILLLLFLPVWASANPVISITKGAEGITVDLSDLDDERAYWVTMVPPDAEEGVYTSFEYIAGSNEASVVFADPDPDMSMEVRLHERGGANALIARALLQAGPAAPAPSSADARTSDFARAYGLAGKWRGEMLCTQGLAKFEVTLRPHFYENGYLGELHLTLVDGPDAGATGVWPFLASYTPKTRGVALTPDAPLSVPVERYSIPQIFGTTLSEDGLRVDGADPQSSLCTEFSFERVPLPAPEEALAASEALRADGFSGEWQGSYECGASMGLHLTFRVDPITGLTFAQWNYRSTAGREFEGEILYSVEAAGFGQIDLVPLKWIKHPNRHQALALAFRIAPDGQALQGEIPGCGQLTVARAGEAPSEGQARILSAAERETLATLAGRWSGFAQCGGAQHAMQIDLPDLAAGESAVDLRYLVTGGRGTVTHLLLDATLADPISLSLVSQQQGPVNTAPLLPAALALDGPGLEIQFEGGACEAAMLDREAPAVTYTALPGSDDQPTILVEEPGSQALRVAPAAQICEGLARWIGTMGEGEAKMVRAGSFVTDYGGWPMLFTDRYFIPVFGVEYSPLTASPAIGKALIAPLRRECGDIGVEHLDLRTALTFAFGAERNSEVFGSKAHAFRLAVATARYGVADAEALEAEIVALPGENASRTTLADLRLRLSALPLLEGDVAQLKAKLDTVAAAITVREEEDFLTSLASGQEAPTPERLNRALGILETRPAERETWLARLESAAKTVAGRIDTGSVPRDIAEELRVFPAIAAALTAADGRRVEADAAAKSALNARIKEVARIDGLRTVLEELRRAGSDPDLMAAYDARAGALLAAAAASIPHSSSTALATEPLQGALGGLRNNVLIGAFLEGDPVVPYLADRDSTMLYLQRMTVVFREYCPAALPPDLQTRISRHFVNLDALTGSRDAVAAEGLRALVDGLNVLADPGNAMARAIRQDEINLMADGDAQILLRSLDCTGPEMRQIFENVRTYVVDPAAGVPRDKLRMAEVCLAALDDGMIMNETRAYCRCAGAELERASADMQGYLRADPKPHFRQIAVLDRNLDRSLRVCRR